jgi:hypothetical protein
MLHCKTRKGTAPAIFKTTSNVKKRRTNWGTGKNLDMLKVAVDEWKNKTGRYFDSDGEPVSLSQFCNLVSIQYPSFHKYVTENGKIQLEIGKSAGHPSIICAKDQATIVDVIAGYDRGNDGRNVSNCINITMEIGGLECYAKCTSARKRACGIFKHIRSKYGTILKKNNVTAQLTTTNRCTITVSKQWDWHTRYETAIGKLCQLNTGVCRVKGKVFGELIQHFIVGGDETCMCTMLNRA